MDPIDVLMNEHQKILQVLACLEKLIWRSEERGCIAGDPAREMIRFFREYADRIHHGKEEDIYFPALDRNGLNANDLIREHAETRLLVGIMELALPGAAEGVAESLDKFRQAGAQYLFLLRRHIRKEDHFLFPVGDLSLDAGEQSALQKRFEEFDQREGEKIPALMALADRLADAFGVSKDRQRFGGSAR